MPKIALITGIAGQDGSYLAQLLLSQGYIVHGITRDESPNLWRHEYLEINGKCNLHTIDLTDAHTVQHLITDIVPHEVYHLAAQSSVAASIQNPVPTLHFNTLSTLYLLQACRAADSTIKFFHASSSEIFDLQASAPLSLQSPIRPHSPYGAAKAAAHFLTTSFREHAGLFAVNGVLFPHESPLRHEGAFTKSLVRQAVAIKNGGSNPIVLGQIDNERDFGSAEEYVHAMWLALQSESARDYIIGTGKSTTIREISYYVFTLLGLDRSLIQSQTAKAPNAIYADTTETEIQLGWKAGGTIYQIMDDMVDFEKKHCDQLRD